MLAFGHPSGPRRASCHNATASPLQLSPLRSRTLRGEAQGTCPVSVSSVGGPSYRLPRSCTDRKVLPVNSWYEAPARSRAQWQHRNVTMETARTDGQAPSRSVLTGAGTHRHMWGFALKRACRGGVLGQSLSGRTDSVGPEERARQRQSWAQVRGMWPPGSRPVRGSPSPCRTCRETGRVWAWAAAQAR